MAIKLVDDVVAPAVVAALDVYTSEKKPTWNRGVGIALSAAGYILGGVMGIGGNLMKNIGIASAPWAMESIYMMAKQGTVTPTARIVEQGPLRMRAASQARLGGHIGRWPSPEMQKELANLRPAF